MVPAVKPADAPSVDFTNVVLATTGKDAQFKKEIETLLEKNITTGVKDANDKIHFYGDDNVTRGQVAAFLFRAVGSPTTVTAYDVNNSFSDSEDSSIQCCNRMVEEIGGVCEGN
ncbi:MAG: S-layer homology domain-containing protein [Candidatus Ancillula trichonymphae]|nr:S-layer homology domain-containing protein [Candidatus Ancillula trichonymphae]